MTDFKIDVMSDPICPRAYFGKGRLDKAIATYKTTVPGSEHDTFTLAWHPLYRDPTLPRGSSVPVDDYLADKFGPDRAAAARAWVEQMSVAEGLACRARGPLGHTRDAHRLVRLAGAKEADLPGLQTRVVSQLFHCCMEEGMDVTSLEQLADAAAKAGLDRDEAMAWLLDGKGGEEVDRAIEGAAARGITEPPHFTVNGRYELNGLPEVEEFVETFRKVKATYG